MLRRSMRSKRGRLDMYDTYVAGVRRTPIDFEVKKAEVNLGSNLDSFNKLP